MVKGIEMIDEPIPPGDVPFVFIQPCEQTLMAEFFQLSRAKRLDALNAVADLSGLPPHLLEKDIWVVWTLHQLFTGPYAKHLVFKGGTSLSKAYGIIQRFSEDVDLTYDIRAIAADLVGDSDTPLPETKSQERKWSKAIRARLSD